MSDHVVLVLLYPGIQPLDVTGPHEVLAGANQALDHLGRSGSRYQLRRVASAAGLVATPSGLALHADEALPTEGRVDTLLVPGGDGAVVAADDGALVDWVRSTGNRAARVASVCSGTFVVAAAGLCAGRRVTTHWSRAGQLARRHPDLDVEPDAIYVHDDSLWSSAGVTAGIDLALALVETDHGPEVAQLVARHLVVHVRRPGGQTQYAAPIWTDPPTSSPIARARDRIHAQPAADLSVTALAGEVGLSPRHLARRFRAEIGEPPARYVERVRIEAARHLLDRGDVGLGEVARRTGFGTPETLRRAFHRRLGCSPDDYRRRFATAR